MLTVPFQATLFYSLPPATSGTVSIPCGPTPAGATCTGGFADLTAAVLAANPNGIVLTSTQITGMRFAPNLNYTGVVNFTYSATDNSGNVSNIANYNIPISGVGNLSPIAQNIQVTPMPNTNGPTAISAFVGSDAEWYHCQLYHYFVTTGFARCIESALPTNTYRCNVYRWFSGY